MLMADKLVYDTEVLYDHHMDEESQEKFTNFYKELFSAYKIKTIHDCSIGAGGSTLPLAKLGYTVSGSDLNENLLNRAKMNFAESDFFPNLFIADFRYFGDILEKNVDCIISTGNSLPHVDLKGFNKFLQSASTKLNDNGLLFFDIRNWDTMVREKPIINAYDLQVMTAKEHRSRYMLFNWHDDGSVTFSLATSVYKNGEHISLDVISTPTSYPLFKTDIERCLPENRYKLIKFIDLDDIWINKDSIKNKSSNFDTDFNVIKWYGVLAQKTV